MSTLEREELIMPREQTVTVSIADAEQVTAAMEVMVDMTRRLTARVTVLEAALREIARSPDAPSLIEGLGPNEASIVHWYQERMAAIAWQALVATDA